MLSVIRYITFEAIRGADSARMANTPNGDGPSTSSSSSIIRDGDNVVMDANGFKTLITIRKGRCVVHHTQTFHSIACPMLSQKCLRRKSRRPCGRLVK